MYKFLILFFLISTSTFAVDIENKEQAIDEQHLELLKKSNSKLEIQNEILRGSANDIQLMYFAALGFSSTFLLAFLGVNVYFSRTKFEEERKSLESLYNVKLAEVSLKLEESTNEKFTEINQDIEELVNSRVKSLQKKIDLQDEAIKNEKLRMKLVVCELESQIITTESTLVRKYIEIAVLANQSDRDWMVGEYLLKADDLISKGVKIGSMTLSKNITMLRSLPEHHEKLINKIESNLVGAE